MAETEEGTVAQFTEGLARRLGEETGALRTQRDVAAVLDRMQEGVIIALHIAGARRFWKKLTAADLGLASSDDAVLSEEASLVLANYFQLGKLSLLPSNKQLAALPDSERQKFVSQEELATLERSARYCLVRYAFKSHWGYFVPVTLYAQWKEENTRYEEDFTRLKERLLAHYEAIVAWVIEAYRPLALDAWRMVSVKPLLRQQGAPTDALLREVTAHLSAGSGQEAFIANYLESIRKAIRPQSEVASSFAYEVERSVIPLPTLLAKDLAESDRLYGERAIRDAQVREELEAIEAERRQQQQEVWTREREEQDRRYLQLQAERERLEEQRAMERDILAEARRGKEKLVRQFYTDVVGQINDQLHMVCTSVLENIEDHEGQLRGPVSRQLRNLVTQLEGLNFMQDRAIEAMLEDIRSALPTREESEQAAKGTAKIDTTRLQTVLRRAQQLSRDVVIDLGMTPSLRRARPGEVIQSDALLTLDTRQARPGTVLAPTKASGARRKKRSPTGSI